MTSLPDLNASLAQLEDELAKLKSASEILQDSESSVTSLVEHAKQIFSTLISQYQLIAQQNLAKAEEVGTRSDRLNDSVTKLLQKMEDPELLHVLKEIKHQEEILSQRISELQHGSERNEQNLKLVVQQIVKSTIELQHDIERHEQNLRLFIEQIVKSMVEVQKAELEGVTKQIIQQIEQLRNGVYAKLKSESDRNESRAKFFAFAAKRQELYMKILLGAVLFVVFMQVVFLIMLKN